MNSENKKSFIREWPNQKTDLIGKIAFFEKEYEGLTDLEAKSHVAYRISQYYYYRGEHVEGDPNYVAYSRNILFGKSAEWLIPAYQFGKPEARYVLYLALTNPDRPNKKHYLETAKALGVPINDQGRFDMLSFGLEYGHSKTCWCLSQAIRFPEHRQNQICFDVLKEYNIDEDDKGRTELNIIASFGNHLNASRQMYYEVQSKKIDQPLLDEIFDPSNTPEIKWPLQVKEVENWTIGVMCKRDNYKKELLKRFSATKLNIIETKQERKSTQKKAEFFRGQVMKNLGLKRPS